MLFADKVNTPGFIRIASIANAVNSADCFPDENVVPGTGRCTLLVDHTGDTDGMDVDNPANRLQITSAGYYSFDVTGITSGAWIADGVQNPALKVDSLLANGTTGSFDFASKEKITGQHILQHNAQLLITLVGAGGITLRGASQNVATVKRESTDDHRLFAQTGSLNA